MITHSDNPTSTSVYSRTEQLSCRLRLMRTVPTKNGAASNRAMRLAVNL
nr:MAG TPA: hypothetical protein [Caudoviricetes sp.]